MALDESNAPVRSARMRPECLGKVLESWKEEMNTNGPPSARKRYPGIYPSKGNCHANAKKSAPIANKKLPRIPQTRGPKLSKMAPIGRAATLVPTAAIVNIRLRCISWS